MELAWRSKIVSDELLWRASAIDCAPLAPMELLLRDKCLSELLWCRACAIDIAPISPMKLTWRYNSVSDLSWRRACAIDCAPLSPMELSLRFKRVSEVLWWRACAIASAPLASMRCKQRYKCVLVFCYKICKASDKLTIECEIEEGGERGEERRQNFEMHTDTGQRGTHHRHHASFNKYPQIQAQIPPPQPF